MSYFNEEDTLDILRYIADYMKGYKFKDIDKKENLINMEEGLINYTVYKLKKFGINIDETKKDNLSLYDLVTMLDKKIPKSAKEKYFFQYLNGTNLILSAMQDKEIELNVSGKNKEVNIIRNPEDNTIIRINIGSEIKPKNRIVELMNTLNNVYEKEPSK